MGKARRCYNCGREWDGPARPSVGDVCPSCHAYVRCCRNCRHYDPGMGNKCRSVTTEPVYDRERANHCDEFDFRLSESGEGRGAQDGRALWDSLWKDG